MEFKDWMSIIAIITSPLIAVWVTMKVEMHRQQRREQMELFKTLMSQRGLATSYEWLNAINSISVIFHDKKEVLTALECFLDAAKVSGTDNLTDFENKRIKLLEVMANSLNYTNIDWEQIRGAYVPVWVTKENEFATKMREANLAYANQLIAQSKHQGASDGVAKANEGK